MSLPVITTIRLIQEFFSDVLSWGKRIRIRMFQSDPDLEFWKRSNLYPDPAFEKSPFRIRSEHPEQKSFFFCGIYYIFIIVKMREENQVWILSGRFRHQAIFSDPVFFLEGRIRVIFNPRRRAQWGWYYLHGPFFRYLFNFIVISLNLLCFILKHFSSEKK